MILVLFYLFVVILSNNDEKQSSLINTFFILDFLFFVLSMVNKKLGVFKGSSD